MTPEGTPTGIVATLASFVIADRKQNEAALDEFRDAGLACLAKGDAAGADLTFDSTLNKYPKFQYPYLYILAPALGKALSTAFAVESDVHATRLLIAIELYKHANGAAPATLDALVPAFFPSIPPDSISGKPWVYKVLPAPDEHGRRFLLYSVGTDGVDNAGTHAIEAKFRIRWERGEGLCVQQSQTVIPRDPCRVRSRQLPHEDHVPITILHAQLPRRHMRGIRDIKQHAAAVVRGAYAVVPA